MVSERFEEIDVQRVNVVDADGTLRMVISGKAKLPDPVIGGRQLKGRQGPKVAGIIFYNDDGDECGGLVFGGSRDPAGTYWAGMHLSFDQFGDDQILVLDYQDENGRRSYGLSLYDRPGAFPVDDVLRLTSMPEGPEKDGLLRELRDSGAFGFHRMFLGRNSEGQPTIALNDSRGRQRLRLSVDSADSPRVEVLDESGRVVYTLPSADDLDRITELERQVLELRQELEKLKDRARA